jgi:hypothetical protein
LPPSKLLLGQYRSMFGFLGSIHVHVLPFLTFVRSKVIFTWIELEKLSVIFLEILVELWVFFGKLRKLGEMSSTFVYVLS